METGIKYIISMLAIVVLMMAAISISSQPPVVYIAPAIQTTEGITSIPIDFTATATKQQTETEKPAETSAAFEIKTITYTLGTVSGKTRPLTVYLSYENPTANEIPGEWQIDVSVSGSCKIKTVPTICKYLNGRNLQTTKRGYDYKPTGGIFVFTVPLANIDSGEQIVNFEITDNISGQKYRKEVTFAIK